MNESLGPRQFDRLPKDASSMLDSDWSYFAPYYEELFLRELTQNGVRRWLGDWTRVTELVDELYNRLYVAITVNTADREGDRRFHQFLDRVFARMQEAEQKLKARLLASGLRPDGFELPLRKMRTEAAIYRSENLPLQVQEQKQNSEYDKIVGAQTVEWEGNEVTTTQLRSVLQGTDRNQRERAWRLTLNRQLADRSAINELWARQLKLRLQQAANAGFPDYRAYRWQQWFRFDYTPENCRQFRDAIEQVMVPAATRIHERRRRRMNLATLRPWDTDVDPLGRPPLRPFVTGAELESKVGDVFQRVDPQLGSYFAQMSRERLLDLDNRKNKAPGAYCTAYQAVKRPFVFLNAVGMKEDVTTLLHEGGHAMHVFESNGLPFYQQRQVPMEFAEVASMSMELLGLPYLDVLYSESELARVVTEQLEKMILFWPYMAVVDGFQHWVYENPEVAQNPENCDSCWAWHWRRFMTGVDWTGLETEMMTGWHRKGHIHQAPFYYVEYGLAQLGASLVYANALKDQKSAVAAYRRALALGGMSSLPELYKTAGARFAFDAGTLQEAAGLLERRIEEYGNRA